MKRGKKPVRPQDDLLAKAVRKVFEERVLKPDQPRKVRPKGRRITPSGE